MKIEKYKKLKNNQYEVVIDNNVYKIYDDIIINNNLLLKKEISESELNNLLEDNKEAESYYLAIKYITKKLRSEKEVKDYLKKNNFSEDNINLTITKLKKYNFLNNEVYIKSYINDQINLTMNGPKKIYNNLIQLGLPSSLINEYLNTIDKNIFKDKIKKIIMKKIKANHNYSNYVLKQKIILYISNLGYEKQDILDILNYITFPTNNSIVKKANIILKKLENKYQDDSLIKNELKNKLYQKGFSKEEIEEYLENIRRENE